MTRITFMIAAALATLAIPPAQAADVTVGSLKISSPWARATPKGASVGGGYMTITNTGVPPTVWSAVRPTSRRASKSMR